jgi:small subunit ribosomal protein S20
LANIKSAKKRIRQNRKRMLRNRMRKNVYRAAVRRFEAAVVSGDVSAAESAFRFASGRIDRAAQKGAIHRNAAARKKSRLARILNTMARADAS